MENGGNHPLGLVAQLYISRKNGVRDLRSVKAECKSTKIKAAVKLFENPDTTMSAVGSLKRRQYRAAVAQSSKMLKSIPQSYT